jgi:hypothetical protein
MQGSNNMKGFIAKSTLILSLTLVVTACKIAVMVPTGGNVVSLSGARNCAGPDFCEFEIVSTPFSESFTAHPKPGYEFEKWSDGGKFQCANSTNPTCKINIADDSLGASIVALFDTAYMMPVFKDIGIDTDDDGVRDSLDEDDDNDGIYDLDDQCPLNSDTACVLITDTITAKGKEWAQVGLFSELSWYQISAVCPNGVCVDGSALNGYNMSGWKWASTADMVDLLGTEDAVYESSSAAWWVAFTDLRIGNNEYYQSCRCYSASGWNSDQPIDSYGARTLVYRDQYGRVSARIGSVSFLAASLKEGAWFYRTP